MIQRVQFSRLFLYFFQTSRLFGRGSLTFFFRIFSAVRSRKFRFLDFRGCSVAEIRFLDLRLFGRGKVKKTCAKNAKKFFFSKNQNHVGPAPVRAAQAGWPSGPRRETQVLFSSEAWVRTPLQSKSEILLCRAPLADLVHP